jgi:hypothetical protein
MFLELIIKCFYVCESDLWQIWLIPLVDDCQCCSITQLAKEKTLIVTLNNPETKHYFIHTLGTNQTTYDLKN